MSLLDKFKPKTSMEAEIYQQPDVLAKIIESYHSEEIDLPKNVKKIVIVASGTSYHCARFAADMLGSYAGLEARSIYSSELLQKNIIPHDKGTLYIFITQSGETGDTLHAVRRVNELGLETLCITNKVDSTIYKLCKYKVITKAGVENSIAATKSFTAQMLCLLIVAIKFAKQVKDDAFSEKVEALSNSIPKIPETVKETLGLRKKIKQLARLICKSKCVTTVADGMSYSLAKEAALKIKETSYMNINAAIMGEFMHGHVAVLNNPKSALIYISVSGLPYTAVQHLNKIKKDYNPSIYIIGKPNERFQPNLNIQVECESDILQAFSNVIITQLLALEIATRLGRNVDKPKGLQKVVLEG